MTSYTFIDRYFHSANELLDIRYKENRDINTLYQYLGNLHSTGDKLLLNFNCNIKNYVEFKILRIIRNYFHHCNDINEIRLEINTIPNITVSHFEFLIIPMEVWGLSLKSFYMTNKKKINFIKKEMLSIYEYNPDLVLDEKIIDNYCNHPSLKLDGVIYELGFDIYKFVYNITNIIADKCRIINDLACLPVIKDLDHTYTESNNIEIKDMSSLVGITPILTTKGYIYAKKISMA